jgi:hypothetical protein
MVIGGKNIQLDLTGIRWGNMDWIGVVQGRNQWRAVVNTAMKPHRP